jgi:hypothetical protein
MTRWLLGIEEAGSGRSDVPGLRACSTLVNGRGHQIVANGVGQTAVEGP